MSGVDRAVGRVCDEFGLDAERTLRALGFSAVGATGAIVDLAVTLTLLEQTHYLLANVSGFVLAVTWNFTGNWVFVFDRPDGRLSHQYLSYVGLHAATFGLRAVAVVALVETTPTPATVATFVGIGVAAVANFLGTERIFDGVDELWLDAIAALNEVAHRIYSSRLRTWLRRLGLYTVLYGAYVAVMGRLYRDSEHTVSVGDAEAAFLMSEPPEVVSIMHTLEKEDAVLEAFVDDLRADDTVWDVGANLGVFACLAGDVADEVVAIEPHYPTVGRCRSNMVRNNVSGQVEQAALGDHCGDVILRLERDELGTQTPETHPLHSPDEIIDGSAPPFPNRPGEPDDYTDYHVPCVTGDSAVDGEALPAPDVLKIDVEGAEVAVLDGCDEVLDRCRLVYCETHGDDVEAIWDQLHGHGFVVDRLIDGQQTYLRGQKP